MVVLAIGFFPVLFVGFGVDLTNLFFRRQMAQNAADPACAAAGMDMLVNQTNGEAAFEEVSRGVQPSTVTGIRVRQAILSASTPL